MGILVKIRDSTVEQLEGPESFLVAATDAGEQRKVQTQG